MEPVTIHIQEEDRNRKDKENKWNVFCFSLDKDCVVYFTQLSILIVCIVVSLIQISYGDNNRDFWISLLSSSIGIIIPNPRIK
jgi:hypothetical protein